MTPADISQLGELIRTQDNRITSHAIFVVEQTDYDNDGFDWLDADGPVSDRKRALLDATTEAPARMRRPIPDGYTVICSAELARLRERDNVPVIPGGCDVALANLRGRALHHFTDYFVRNYPGPDTIISDPRWHAPRIFRAMQHALATAATEGDTHER